MTFRFNNPNIQIDNNVSKEINQESIKASEKNPMYSPLDEMFQPQNVDISTFKNLGTPNPYVFSPEAYETRARAQSGTRLAGNAAAQFMLGEFIGGTISGVGTLLAPNKWIDRISNVADAWEPTFMEKLGETIQSYTKEQFPIYQTQRSEQGVALGDASWWATMTPSVASALSIMIPARLASILPVKLAGVLTNTGKAGKSISAIQKAQHWTNVASSAFAGRMIDSTRESLGRYSQYYEENKALGMSDQEARETAAEAASKGFRLSHANIVFDLVEWGLILRSGNYLKGDVDSKIKNLLFKNPKYTGIAEVGEGLTKEIGKSSKLKGLAKDMFFTGMVEGVDEMTMDTFQQEGKYQSDIEKGLRPKSSFQERLKDQFGERKSWDSFIGGMLGGVLMMPLGTIIQKTTNKGYIEELNKQADIIVGRAEKANIHLETISKHLDNNDKEKAQFEKDEMILDLINQSASNNTLSYDMDMFDNMSKLTPEQIKVEGLNPEVLDYINDIKSNAKEIKRIFDNEMDVVRLRDSKGNIDEANTYLNTRIADAKARRVLFNKRIKENVITDPDSTEFKDNDLAFSYLNTLIYNYNESDTLKSTLENYNKELLNLVDKIEELTTELPSIKDVATRMIHQGIIKSAKAQKEFIENSIKETNNKLGNLSETQKLRKDIFSTLDPIVKEKVENRFKDLKPDSYKSRVDVYKNAVDYLDNNIEFWNTKEGKESLKHEYDTIIATTEEATKKEVQDKVDKATTKEEVETIRKEYAKKNIDRSIYEPIIKSKLNDIGVKESVTTQTTRVEDEVARLIEEETKVKVGESGAAPITQDRSGSFVSDTAPTRAEVTTSDNDILTPFDKLNNLSKSATTLLNQKQEDLNITAEEFLINPNYSAIAHAISMFDVLLKDKTIRELFRKTGIVEGKFKVSDIFTKLDAFNDFNTPNVEEVNNIISSIFNASSKIINGDATRGYTATLINDQLISQVKGNVDTIKDEALDLINITDKNVENTVKDVISNYIDSLEVKTISFATSLDTDTYVDEDLIKRPSDIVIAYNVGTEKTLSEITNNLQSGINTIKTLLQNKATRLGHAPKAITFDDIIKYLRDQDQDNTIVNDNWFRTLQALKLIKAQLAYNIATQKSLKTTDANTQQDIANEIKRLEELDNILDIKSLPYTENKGQQYVDEFLKSHPRQVRETTKIPGTRAVLNVYDERTGKRVEFDDTFRVTKGNNIWQALQLIKEGTKVTFKEDSTITYEGKPAETDWQTIPIRVNVKDENGKETTVLFVRELDYMDSGIRYGYKNDSGEFEFRGVGAALNNNDYQTLYDNFDIIREFYSNYYKAKSDIKTSEKDKAEDIYLKLLKDIKSNKELNDIFLKVINNNFTETEDLIDTLNPKTLISIINPLFYKINLEDVNDYFPTPKSLKFKIDQKDKGYESDFESVKQMRKSISEGTLSETTISNVTTPSVIINPHKSKDGEELPRLTLDRDIKPITLGTNPNPRIVTVMFHKSSNSFVDMTTGEAIIDPRFDYSKTMSQHILKGNDATMYVLLESIGGKLIAFPTKTNTIGLSYKNETDRNAAIDFVTSKLIAAERASTATQLNTAASETRHITIFDQTRNLKTGDRHWFDTHFIPDGGIETAYGFREASNFIRIKTNQDINSKDGNKKSVFYQIENEGRKGIITIYKSTYWNDLANRNKGSLIKDSEGNVITFDINTTKGVEELTVYLKNEIVPNMQRQVHSDMSKGKFAYSKEMIGTGGVIAFETNTERGKQELKDYLENTTEDKDRIKIYEKNGISYLHLPQEKVIDPITTRTYDSPSDYYIQTGALYSDVGSVKDNSGNVLTNFDVQGRFPMAVHLNIGKKKQIARTVDGIEGLIEEGIIDQNDPYISFIKTVAKSTGIKPKIEIKGVSKDNVSASMQRTGKRWLLSVYEGFFNQQVRNNPYIPANLLIAHEYLHIALSKSYLPKEGESQQDIDNRNKRIATHNRELTTWVNEVETYWNGIDNKTDFIKKAFANVSMSNNRAESNVAIFENYIKAIKQDVANTNGVGSTIQEPITYAFSTPIIAVVLNNMSSTDALNTKVKTAWDKLRDLFFKILNSIFGIELNDKGFLLKLNHIINEVYSKTVTLGEDQARSISEQKKGIIVQEDVSELNVIPEVKTDIGISEDPDIEMEEQYAEALDITSTFYITSESKSLESLIGQIIEPHDQLLDVLNNPIC